MRFALLLDGDAPASAGDVARMLAVQSIGPACGRRTVRLPHGAAGFVTRPGREAELERSLRVAPDGGFAGICGAPVSPVAMATLLDALLAEPDEAESRLTALDGHFVAVVWHPGRDRLLVVTDFAGMAPVFAARTGSRLGLASSELALVAGGAATREPDAAGWGSFLAFRMPMGDRTKLRDVRRVGGASVRTYDGTGRLTREHRYWDWPRADARSPFTLPELVGELDTMFQQTLARYPADTLMLSGGYDSRVIAGMLARNGARPRALIQQHADQNADADGTFAAAVARGLRLPHDIAPADADFFSTPAFLDYLRESEIAVPSLGLFIATTAGALTPDRGAVWLDTVLDPLLKRNGAAPSVGAYVRDVLGAGRAIPRLAELALFTPEWRQEMTEGVRMVLADEMARCSDDAAGARAFRVRTRTRHRIGAHFYRSHDGRVPVVTPGLARDTWSTLSAGPAGADDGQALMRALFAEYFPAAARVPFESGTTLSWIAPRAIPRYAVQRARTLIDTIARRPKARRITRALGLAGPFAWQPSRFVEEAARDFGAMEGPELARQRAPVAASDDRAREAAFYWTAQHRLLDAVEDPVASLDGGAWWSAAERDAGGTP